MAKVYKLTEEDIEIFGRAMEDPNIFFAHFFKKKGVDRPFQLDYNFEEGSKWQVDFCMAAEHLLVNVAGISTGKTLAVGMSACYHASTTRSFKFLNIAKEGFQAEIMYNNIIEMSQDTLFEKLIYSKPKRPYAKIVIAFNYDGLDRFSELIFRSIGEKGDASNVMSTRFDWVNVEEAGLVPDLGTIVKNLVSRLTGSTAEGRPYLGRMSLISNPNDNPELWSIFDMAEDNTDGDSRVWTINTDDNKNTTEAQIKFAMKLIGAEDQERYMTGNRPKGKGKYFSNATVDKCESEVVDIAFKRALKDKPDGFESQYEKSMSYWHFEMPYNPNRQYMVFGDPGTGKAPRRNAPTLLVFDVSEAPRLSTLEAMWWGDGGGSIEPFIDWLLRFIGKYKPLAAGIDSTAAQKYMAQLVNHHYIDGNDYSIESVDAMDFSGAKKFGYLVSLRLSMELASLQWPTSITSIGQQLRMYDPAEDKNTKSKLPQDIVSTLCLAAQGIRSYFSAGIVEDDEKPDEAGDKVQRSFRQNNRAIRTRAGRGTPVVKGRRSGKTLR